MNKIYIFVYQVFIIHYRFINNYLLNQKLMKNYRILNGLLFILFIFLFVSCTQDAPPNGGGTTAEVNLQDGLIAYYPFTGNVQDLSGHGHNGISHNTSLTTDRFGNNNQALELQGSMTSYLEIPHNNELNLGGDFTICFWINKSSISHDYMIAFGKGRDLDNFYGLIFDGTTGAVGGDWTLNFLLTNSQGVFQPCAEVTTFGSNTWHFVALIQNQAGNKHGLYMDTEFIAENPYFNFQANNIYPLVIGRHYLFADGSGGWEYPFKGYFDDLRIYNRALNNDELAALYNATGE